MSEQEILARAKRAWDEAVERDDLYVRPASEARLAARWPRSRSAGVSPARWLALGAAVAIVAVLATSFWRLATPTQPVSVAPTQSAVPAVQSQAPLASASVAPAPAATSRGLVAVGACEGCKVAGALLSRDKPIALGTRLEVPANARASLAFAIDEHTVDLAAGVDLIGPAAARAELHGAAPAVVLESGIALARAHAGFAPEVVSGLAVVHATDAEWRVQVQPGATRVQVDRGTVDVLATGPLHEHRALTSGQLAEIDPEGHIRAAEGPIALPTATSIATATATPTATATSTSTSTSTLPDGERLRAARTKLREGDRVGAEHDLRALALEARDPRVVERASLSLAEVELARGDRDAARARLTPLVRSTDPALGEDAAVLLARSHPAGRARAAVWTAYLATSPPSPHRERALLDKAEALVQADARVEAREVLEELRQTGYISEETQQRMRMLESQLGR